MKTMSTLTSHVRAVLLGSMLTCGTCYATTPTSPVPSLKRPLPLEQIISQIRKHHGDIIIQTTRLSEEDRRTVRVVDFSDSHHNRHRMVIDAFTGKELELVPLKAPMPIEKALDKVRSRHQTATILRTWLDQRDGNPVRVVELLDKQHKRWQTTLDAYTGLIISEHMFELKPSGRQVSLSQVIQKARQNHKNMIVMRTRLTHRKGTQVREIFYLDENSLHKRLTVNASTGEVIEDKMIAGLH
ncbi:MAG: PepSY domain-containing protein [Endozoicomonas sp.]